MNQDSRKVASEKPVVVGAESGEGCTNWPHAPRLTIHRQCKSRPSALPPNPCRSLSSRFLLTPPGSGSHRDGCHLHNYLGSGHFDRLIVWRAGTLPHSPSVCFCAA